MQAIRKSIPQEKWPVPPTVINKLEGAALFVALRIGPLAFTVESRTPLLARMVRRHFSSFSSGTVSSPLRIVLDSSFASDFDPFPRNRSEMIERRSSYWTLRATNYEAAYFPRYRMVWASVPEDTTAISKLFKILTTLWMEKQGGVLMHGATVVHRNRGYIFSDESAGTLLNQDSTGQSHPFPEDHVSLLAESASHGYCVHGTPFGGNSSEAGLISGLPLVGLYYLKPAGDRRVVPVSKANARGLLMHRLLWFAKDWMSIEAIRNQVQHIVSHVPSFEVCFPLNGDWKKVLNEPFLYWKD